MASENYQTDGEGAAVDDKDDLEEMKDEIDPDSKIGVKLEGPDDIDPSLADWLKVEEDKDANERDAVQDDSATETDVDSDNEDVKVEPEEDLGNWLSIKPGSSIKSSDLEVRLGFCYQVVVDIVYRNLIFHSMVITTSKWARTTTL
jgi:hypothetical protein